MTITFDIREIRLSELARGCPRMCVLRAYGTPAKQPSEQEQRYLERGQLFERLVLAKLQRKYGPENLEHQREIVWPHGVGHADIYVRPEKLIVEVVSTVAPTGGILEFKIAQAKRYLHYDPDAERAAVYVINPSDLSREDVIPIRLTDADVAEIEAEAAALDAALQPDTAMPARVCARPSDGRARMCSFIGPCFEGWEQPDRTLVVDDETARAAVDLAVAEGVVKKERAELSLREQERDLLRARLAEHVGFGDHDIAGIRVRRTEVDPRVTMRVALARKTGAFTAADEERFAPFISVGAPSERWTVEPAAAGSPDDFGDEAPF